ncbi:hypothetical protein PIB30_004761 [Stylosanthes scabra]|uniref:Helitron helicase-like domain-containing protein n=1 Tax=Stylosanthes scabra TaxID=79078 RepID=A0ABU6T3G7_9FABA|nr:hypothetical protein [Stylosanthes scabra]
MGERFDLVTDIHQRNMHWHIQVYFIRMYDVPSTEEPSTIKSIDLILQDREVANNKIRQICNRGIEHKWKEQRRKGSNTEDDTHSIRPQNSIQVSA